MKQSHLLSSATTFIAILGVFGSGLRVSQAESWDFFESPARTKTPKVEIYVADWCPYCKKLERYLKDNQIRYVRHDIEESTAAAARHKSLGGGGVPVIVIGSKLIRGFNQQALEDALKETRPKESPPVGVTAF